MKNRKNYIPLAVASLALAAATVCLQAQIITPNPNLPPVYPDGVYRTPAGVHATFSGPGLAIVLTNIEHRAFSGGGRTNSGPNEIETFSSEMVGLINVNGGAFFNANATGPVMTEVFGKVGNVTGTFQTEMLSLNLSGTSPFGPFMIRESPTRASLGQTTITDVGGGLFKIDSFFDVFTELSIDGGATWMPDTSGPSHVVLQPTPEPSPFVLVLAGVLSWTGLRRISRRQ